MADRGVTKDRSSPFHQNLENERTALGLGEGAFGLAAGGIAKVNGQPTMFGSTVAGRAAVKIGGPAFMGADAVLTFEHYRSFVDKDTKEPVLSIGEAAALAGIQKLASIGAAALATPFSTPLGGVAAAVAADNAFEALADNTITKGPVNTLGILAAYAAGALIPGGSLLIGDPNKFGDMADDLADDLASQLSQLADALDNPTAGPRYAGSGRLPGEPVDMTPGNELNYLDQISEDPFNRDFWDSLEDSPQKRLGSDGWGPNNEPRDASFAGSNLDGSTGDRQSPSANAATGPQNYGGSTGRQSPSANAATGPQNYGGSTGRQSPSEFR